MENFKIKSKSKSKSKSKKEKITRQLKNKNTTILIQEEPKKKEIIVKKKEQEENKPRQNFRLPSFMRLNKESIKDYGNLKIMIDGRCNILQYPPADFKKKYFDGLFLAKTKMQANKSRFLLINEMLHKKLSTREEFVKKYEQICSENPGQDLMV